MDTSHEKHDTLPSFWSSRHALGLVVIGGVAGYFLLTEHLAHVVGALPYLFLLACPLMHFFMHGGHGHHHGPHHQQDDRGNSDSDKPGERS